MVPGHMTPARFRALRQAAGVTVTDAARFMGVTPQCVSKYEHRRDKAVGEWRLLRCSDWLAERAREARP